jgi:acyl-CoA thioester hydrolase
VEAADIDGLEHTNNAVYVKWCERVAWAHSGSLGLDLACYQQLDRAMVITRSEFDYLRASKLGDNIAVATWITDCDQRLTMERHFQVVRLGDGITLLRARMEFACVELSSGKPRRLPAEFLDGYGVSLLPN